MGLRPPLNQNPRVLAHKSTPFERFSISPRYERVTLYCVGGVYLPCLPYLPCPLYRPRVLTDPGRRSRPGPPPKVLHVQHIQGGGPPKKSFFQIFPEKNFFRKNIFRKKYFLRKKSKNVPKSAFFELFGVKKVRKSKNFPPSGGFGVPKKHPENIFFHIGPAEPARPPSESTACTACTAGPVYTVYTVDPVPPTRTTHTVRAAHTAPTAHTARAARAAPPAATNSKSAQILKYDHPNSTTPQKTKQQTGR